jgi:ATP-dependent DNA helicase RecG
MTATPIPRTLALTIYGDLDLTLLDEMPPGRKRVITETVKPTERQKAYAKMHEELAEGRQAYVICPRIDEPDPDKAFALMAKSVKEEAKRLKKEIFPQYEIDILHSKMTPKEKDAVMARFIKHEVDILVATSVVEVGVNVPNATLIMIEGAERFGLSQLHQLRGRVVRSNHQAYCFVCPESRGESTVARLKALVTAKNGFELAEQDLLQRGPGELSGRKQWGISDIGMEAIKNLKLVEAAREEALALIQKDIELKKHPLLAKALTTRAPHMHFE